MCKSSSISSLLMAVILFSGCATGGFANENDTKDIVDYFCKEMIRERRLGTDAQAFFEGFQPYSSAHPEGHLNYKHPLLADLRFNPNDEFRNKIKLTEKGTNGDTLIHCAIKNKIKPAYERLVEGASLTDLQILDGKGRSIIYYAKTFDDRFFYKKIESVIPREILKKEQLCNGEKAMAKFSAQLDARRDSDIRGLALDKAQNKIVEFRAKSEALVKKIFENKILSLFGEESERTYLEGIKFYSAGAEVQPDPDAFASINKFSEMATQYTFMISKKDQERLFESKSLEDEMPAMECNDSVDRNHSGITNGFVGLNSDCKFSPSKALEDQKRAWLYIARKFTTVKQAPSKDGSSILYDVSLDLTPFCAYAVAVEDLKAR